ncbi:MAG: hypothetical protein PHR59_04645 [Candidatus Cloacimonetes bacterium]|nr:hypothetical protein [Candidatus Cloacimonadota bacterium]
MKIKLVWLELIILMTLFFSVCGAETVVTIGMGDFTSHYPFNDYYTYTHSQQLYLASEIGSPGTITKLRWYRTNPEAEPDAIGTTEIWLSPYHYNEFVTADWEDPGTLVATISDIDLESGPQWFEVDISDYEYCGSNLMVSVRTQDAPWESPHANWHATDVYPLHYAKEGHDDVNLPDYMVYGNTRPNIQLVMEAFAPSTVPNPALVVNPQNAASDQMTDISLSWNSGGGMPSGYHIYLGTDNPPSNIVNGVDLGNSYVYTPTLGLGQTYYWQIVPYNSIGSAAGCPVWSFSTLSPISTFPHSYGFEEEQYPPGGWHHTIISGATGIQRVSSSIQPGASPHTGSWMGWYNCRELSNGSSARLSSPPVQRTEDGYNYAVSFWMYRDSGYSTRADRVNVWAGNRDLQGATLMGTINRSKDLSPVETGANGWYQYSFALPDGVTDFVTLETISAYGYNICLDDIVFTKTPEGGSPPGFAANPSPYHNAENVLPDVDLSWDSVDGATTYKITIMNAANEVTQVVDTSTPGYSYSAEGYDEQVKWSVDPGNEWGYASSLGSPPVWQYTTLPPNVPGPYPVPGTTEWNPSNRLLDWESLPGADSYIVSVGTNPGATDIVNSVPVTDTKYIHPTDFPESSSIYWQAKPIRDVHDYEDEWKALYTDPNQTPEYPVAVSENFDSSPPPSLPQGFRGISKSTTCGAGVSTDNTSTMSPPNQAVFYDGGDPLAQQSLVSDVILPSLRPWHATINFKSYLSSPGNPGSMTVQCVSDQSSNPIVYSQETIAIPATPTQFTATLEVPAGVPCHVAFNPSSGIGTCYLDDIVVESLPPDPPVGFKIIRNGMEFKLQWEADIGYFMYRVYQSETPNGPWILLDQINDIYNNSPVIECDLAGHLNDPAKYYYVTAEWFSPYAPIDPTDR